MELRINNTICDLRALNTKRRVFLMGNLFPLFNAKKKVENKVYSDSIKKSIWKFLFPIDKKELKHWNNIKIKKTDCNSFIKWISDTFNKYRKYVEFENQTSRGGKGCVMSTEEIHSFLSKETGMSVEEMEEMDELKLLKYIKIAIKNKKKKDLEKIAINSLSSAYSKGNNKAKSKVREMQREIQSQERLDNIRSGNRKVKNSLVISERELSGGKDD